MTSNVGFRFGGAPATSDLRSNSNNSSESSVHFHLSDQTNVDLRSGMLGETAQAELRNRGWTEEDFKELNGAKRSASPDTGEAQAMNYSLAQQAISKADEAVLEKAILSLSPEKFLDLKEWIEYQRALFTMAAEIANRFSQTTENLPPAHAYV